MNYVESFDQPHAPVTARATEVSPIHREDKRRRWGGRLLGLGVLVVLVTGLGLGAWRYDSQQQAAMAAAQQRRDFVPTLRVAAVRSRSATAAAATSSASLTYNTERRPRECFASSSA